MYIQGNHSSMYQGYIRHNESESYIDMDSTLKGFQTQKSKFVILIKELRALRGFLAPYEAKIEKIVFHQFVLISLLEQ